MMKSWKAGALAMDPVIDLGPSLEVIEGDGMPCLDLPAPLEALSSRQPSELMGGVGTPGDDLPPPLELEMTDPLPPSPTWPPALGATDEETALEPGDVAPRLKGL